MVIKFYQKYISPLLGNNCRFYPTCSEYAKIEFQKNSFLWAIFYSAIRILKCNQLFEGGIDYPIIRKKIRIYLVKKLYTSKIIFFLVPKGKNKFYLIRRLNCKTKT